MLQITAILGSRKGRDDEVDPWVVRVQDVNRCPIMALAEKYVLSEFDVLCLFDGGEGKRWQATCD